MTIGVVQPDSGNITSVRDALDRLGRNYKLLRTPQLDGVDQLFLPGQGRFGAVMRYLRENGWVAPLKEWTAADKPFLGICVGMQVLFDGSDEDPNELGLGIFEGRVTRLDSPKHPMIGWSTVNWSVDGFQKGAAYFVNSFGVAGHDSTIASTTYGATYSVAFRRGNTLAFQFHPEKSGRWGKELLDQCLIS